MDVPADIGRAVYATVGLRKMGTGVDGSWAPWWRAQARAIHAVLVAGARSGRWQESKPGMFDWTLQKDLLFADYLDGTLSAELHNQKIDALRTSRPA